MKSTARERLGALVAETGRLWRRRLDARLRPLGLSQSQWLVLAKLGGEGVAQAALAELLGIEAPTLVGLIDRLESNGWVERRASAADRRVRLVHPTRKARAAQQRIAEAAGELRKSVLAGLSDGRLRACAGVLEEIKARLETLDG